MNVRTLSVAELNSIELIQIEGGIRIPKPVMNQIKKGLKDTLCCIEDFAIGVWEGIVN